MSMDPTQCLLVALVMAAFPCLGVAGENDAPASRSEAGQVTREHEVSPYISLEITAGLPKYGPTDTNSSLDIVPKEAPHSTPGSSLSDAVILLPAYILNEKPVKIEEKQIYTPDTYTLILMKRHLSELDYEFLNRFTLPFFGSASREKRAREAQWRQEWKEMAEELRLFEQVK